jgi:hypothetical protein
MTEEGANKDLAEEETLRIEIFKQTRKIEGLCGQLNDVEQTVLMHIQREELIQKRQTVFLGILVVILVLLSCLALRVL